MTGHGCVSLGRAPQSSSKTARGLVRAPRGEGFCGTGVEGGIAGAGLVFFRLEAVNDLSSDVILPRTRRGRGGDAKAWRIFFFRSIFFADAPEFEELLRNNAF